MPDNGPRDPVVIPPESARLLGRAALDPQALSRRRSIDRIRFEAQQELEDVQAQLTIARAALIELERQERDLLRFIQYPRE